MSNYIGKRFVSRKTGAAGILVSFDYARGFAKLQTGESLFSVSEEDFEDNWFPIEAAPIQSGTDAGRVLAVETFDRVLSQQEARAVGERMLASVEDGAFMSHQDWFAAHKTGTDAGPAVAMTCENTQSGTFGPAKPTRVEVRQRWQRTDGSGTVYTIAATCEDQCSASRAYGHGQHAHFDNGQDAPSNWVMEFCTYLGMAETGPATGEIADVQPSTMDVDMTQAHDYIRAKYARAADEPKPRPPASACSIGAACTQHNPRKVEPYAPSITDWDLLPDA